MFSHPSYATARRLVTQTLADIEARQPDDAICARLAVVPKVELLRMRRIIDRHLVLHTPPNLLTVMDGGQPFREWLADELDQDHEKVRRLLTFIDEYGASTASRGRAPTMPELAADTEQSVATVNRRLAEFRTTFPSERDPGRLAETLRAALDDESLWEGIDGYLDASIDDVPVFPNRSRLSSTPLVADGPRTRV